MKAILREIWLKIKLLPLFLYHVALDVFRWIKGRGWTVFNGWGLHIFLGAFGQGKTCSMVYRAYQICNKYPQVTLLTNVTVANFPKHTKILHLDCWEDILNAPDNTLVMIDEIGTIFNSRDFAKSKESVPKILFQHLCQCRHRNMEIFGTVQRWNFLDKQLRDITADVTVCSASFAHPFSRLITNRTFDAYDYDLFCQNPLRPLLTLDVDVFVQTDKVRSLYDTVEMVNTLLQKEYIPDSEIMANRGEPAASGLPEWATKRDYKKSASSAKKHGL